MDEAFNTDDPVIKEAHRLLNTQDNKKKLKVVGWVACAISFIGILLNAWKIIWCWPVWCVANFFWIYWAIKKKEGSQVFLWIVFTLANLYGWFMWLMI